MSYPGLVLNLSRGTWSPAPPDASSRDRAIDCELRRDELPAGLAAEVEGVVREASKRLGLDLVPRVRWLPKGAGVRGIVYPEALYELWVQAQDRADAINTALHEVKHIEQLRGSKYLELKLFTMEQRQADADAFARNWKPLAFKRGGPLEIKASSSSDWMVSGYASTFGDPPDAHGDVVAPGAFAASIAERPTKFLFEHREPIGKQLELREDSHGLWGRWSIVDTTAGTDARKLIQAGVIGALSIGYVPVDSVKRSDGARVLTEVSLYEVSAVAIPANSNAVITGVKSQAPARLDIKAEMARRRRIFMGRRVGTGVRPR